MSNSYCLSGNGVIGVVRHYRLFGYPRISISRPLVAKTLSAYPELESTISGWTQFSQPPVGLNVTLIKYPLQAYNEMD